MIKIGSKVLLFTILLNRSKLLGQIWLFYEHIVTQQFVNFSRSWAALVANKSIEDNRLDEEIENGIPNSLQAAFRFRHFFRHRVVIHGTYLYKVMHFAERADFFWY